jgi:[acyl-carrier-protein] S-malonyltransferase
VSEWLGLFPGQGIPAKTVLGGLPPDDPMLGTASEVCGYDLRRRVDIAARRKGALLPTSIAQPAIYVASLISFRRAEAEGRSFGYFVGHSLGEFSALAAAGAFGFADGLRCVVARAEAMQVASRNAPGGMAAVLGLDLEAVEGIAARAGVQIGNDNAPEQTVLSGSEEGLAAAAALVRSQGGRSVLLEVSGPFHTVAMSSAGPILRRALAAIEVNRPRTPVVSNVPARPHGEPDAIVELLVQQLSSRVRFRESVEWVHDREVTQWCDLGPGRVVAGLAQRTLDAPEHRGIEASA